MSSVLTLNKGERAVTAKLKRLLAEHSGDKSEFTLNDLYDLLHPDSREELAMVLADLVKQGKIKQVIRVISPTKQGGIKDFNSLDDVPQSIHDWRTDTEIEVHPDDLRVVYKT